LSAGVVLVVSCAGTPAAGDVHDLQEGLPLEVEDTQTAEYRKVQAQASGRYELSDEGDDELRFDPQLQYGAGENWHVELTYPSSPAVATGPAAATS
jgi:hypothetical protein